MKTRRYRDFGPPAGVPERRARAAHRPAATRDAAAASVTAAAVRPRSRRSMELAFRAAFTLGAAGIGGAALLLAYAIQNGNPFCGGGFCDSARPYVPVFYFAIVARGLLFVLGGHHRNRLSRGYTDEIVEAVLEGGLGWLANVVFTFYWRGGVEFRTFSYSRGVFLLDWLFASAGLILLLVAMKYSLGRLRSRGHDVRRVALVGSGDAAIGFVEELRAHPEMGYVLVAQLDDDCAKRGDFVEELQALTSEGKVDEVVLATPAIQRADLTKIVSTVELRHAEVRAVPELFGLPPTKVSLDAMGEFPLLSLLQEPLGDANRIAKRAMDLLIGTVAMTVAAPVMLVSALAVRLSSKGPVLFRQQRIGMDGRPFDMLKFRTMVTDADASIHQEFVEGLIRGDVAQDEDVEMYKLTDDPRVTKVGRILRRTSIDELPQLINVLRGEMSVVGPRPPLLFEVELYEEWHRRRLEVRPGMTGLWQVSGRSKMTFDEMVRLDIHYIETWSPLRDISIVLRTIPALLRKEAS
ncbi:MAG TPA: sugar transferase [Actinomycetota bacterium]|nr:sugar transferase [Actinomycetota bacterium]